MLEKKKEATVPVAAEKEKQTEKAVTRPKMVVFQGQLMTVEEARAWDKR